MPAKPFFVGRDPKFGKPALTEEWPKRRWALVDAIIGDAVGQRPAFHFMTVTLFVTDTAVDERENVSVPGVIIWSEPFAAYELSRGRQSR